MKWNGKLMSDTEKNKIKYKIICTLYINKFPHKLLISERFYHT